MAKRTPVREYDKFMLRLPPGMRERIKDKAERADMSMNEAIVWCLDQFFPAPVTLEQRLQDLTKWVSILKGSEEPLKDIETLIAEIEDTVVKIASEKLPTNESFSQMVRDRLERLSADSVEDEYYQNENPFKD